MKLKETVNMLSNITVVDSHFITIYSGTTKDMVRYFTEEERTLDYLNMEVEGKVFKDDEVVIFLGERSYLTSMNTARNIFMHLVRICEAFNDNMECTMYNAFVNEFFRGVYTGIHDIAKMIGYDVCIKHYNDIVIYPIRYCAIAYEGTILYEKEFEKC